MLYIVKLLSSSKCLFDNFPIIVNNLRVLGLLLLLLVQPPHTACDIYFFSQGFTVNRKCGWQGIGTAVLTVCPRKLQNQSKTISMDGHTAINLLLSHHVEVNQFLVYF
jgi:hypothetical protein